MKNGRMEEWRKPGLGPIGSKKVTRDREMRVCFGTIVVDY
jgi:hypothetical protein